MRIKHVVSLVVLTFSTVLLCGCPASHQARWGDVNSAILVKPEIFKEGTGDQALYRYVKPGFDIKKYSAIMIEPLLIAKDGEMSSSQRENYQKLANNAYVYLVTEVEKQIKLAKEPGNDVLTLQMAIHDADSSKPLRTITSSVTPIGAGLSVLKYASLGKPSGVGEITAEYRLTESVSGELLFAAMDRRVGGKTVKGIWDTWYNADDALQYWAKRIGFLLCENYRQGKDCKEP